MKINCITKLGIMTAMLLLTLSLVACNSSRVNFILRFESVNISLSGRAEETIISSLEEWNALDLDSCLYTPIILEEINEQFFTNRSLIVFIFSMGQSGNEFVKVNLNRNENVLMMDVVVNAGITDRVIHGIIVLEVNNLDLVGIDSLVIELEQICPQIWMS